MDHLDSETLYALIDGALPPARAGRAEAHLLRCDACRARREECGAVVSALGWYAAEPPRPPAGYWEEFWDRWPGARRGRPLSASPRFGRVVPALALAASIALVVGLWTARHAGVPAETTTAALPTVRLADWSDDYALFERMTIAVGSVDPMSKGVALAGLAESP